MHSDGEDDSIAPNVTAIRNRETAIARLVDLMEVAIISFYTQVHVDSLR